mgnify:CR=1 FL=1
MRIARKQGHHPIVLDHGSDYLTFGNKAADILVQAYEHAITTLGKAYNPRYFGVSDRSLHWLRHFGIEGEGIYRTPSMRGDIGMVHPLAHFVAKRESKTKIY